MRTGPARAARRLAPGFSMLELVLAMLLLALLVGMIFGTAQSALSLGNAVTSHQRDAMTESAFFELLDRQIGGLPGNARMQLTFTDSTTQYLSDLTIENVPLSFSWGGTQVVPRAVRLSTVQRRDGLLDIVLKYYDAELLSEAAAGSTEEPEPFATVVLLGNVGLFEWRVLDARTMEWQYDWLEQGRLPLQVELVMTQGPRGPKVRHIMWIVPKQNPEVMMRQLGAGGVGAQPGDGDDGGDGGGGSGGGGGGPGGGGGFGGGGSGGGVPVNPGGELSPPVGR